MEEKKTIINPLQNKRVIVRHLHKDSKITDKRHLLYGGMAENAAKTFTVPVIASTGVLKNVLTNSEKEFFENLLGVNMSVHNKKDNYWDNFKVRLTKSDNYLDLSVPEDYIKYKVLLANTNLICPSMKDYQERPLATYQFVITSDDAELEMAGDKRKIRVECYKLAGKIENDFDTLKAVIELLDKRPIADKTSVEFLANKLDEFIDSDPKEVHRILTDESLKSMVFIKKCAGAGLIVRSGDFYYLKSGKSKVPMCEDGRDPDIKQAVKYINNPKNQEIKFSLEAKLNNPED